VSWKETGVKSSPMEWNLRRNAGHASAACTGPAVAPKYSTRLQVETSTASRRPSCCFISASAAGIWLLRNATFSRSSTAVFSKVRPPQTICSTVDVMNS
jgi:hypothetical protein